MSSCVCVFMSSSVCSGGEDFGLNFELNYLGL